jgi:hypothetical protein
VINIDDPRLSAAHTGAGRLQRIVLQLLLEHQAAAELPTSARFIFYELEGRGVVRKSARGESRRGTATDPREIEVSEALMELRRRGVVPWGWIVDETRTLHEWEYARSVADYVRRSVDVARINPWPGEPPLLLVESRSLGGVLRTMASQYLVAVAATNGQVGGFLYTEVAPVLAGNDRIVLYLGDHDLQGHQIEANTRDVLVRATGRAIGWTRLAITEEQIAERGLTPIWKRDNRYRPALEHQAWEAEALGQGTIQGLVRDALDQLLPEPLEAVLRDEDEQRERVAEALDGLDL